MKLIFRFIARNENIRWKLFSNEILFFLCVDKIHWIFFSCETWPEANKSISLSQRLCAHYILSDFHCFFFDLIIKLWWNGYASFLFRKQSFAILISILIYFLMNVVSVCVCGCSAFDYFPLFLSFFLFYLSFISNLK